MANRVVYERPYDSEIEYLESGNTQFIDTGIIATNNTNFKLKVYTDSKQRQILGQYEVVNNNYLAFGVYYFNNSNKLVLYGVNSTYLSTCRGISGRLVEMKLHDNQFTIDSYAFNVTRNNIIKNKTLYLFKMNGLEITPNSHLKMYYCKIWNGDTLVRDFIPVRRGSVGYMYDRVSGKLFGNKGTGNFILGPDVANPIPNIRRVFRFGNKRFVVPIPYDLEEGIDYQRYDWLKGDGTAYINTYIVVNVPSLYINTSFTKITNVKNTPLFGARNIVGFHGSHIFYMSDESLRFDIMSDKNPCITTTEIQNINQLIIDCPNKVLNFNGTIFASRVNDLSIKNSTNTFKIFSMEVLNTKGSTMNAPYNGAFGDFILNDFAHSIHLTPCQLLRSIPTYLDANGKARQTGECGMIDLISGKFYGNVANAGTFTVENNN